MVIGTGNKDIRVNRGGVSAPDIVLVAGEFCNGSLLGNVPELDKGVIPGGDEVELVEDREVHEADGAGVGAEAAEGGAGLDIKDLDEAGKVGGGEEKGVRAEGSAGDGVGEGGDLSGGGEGLGAEEREGGGVGGGEGVRMCGREGEGRNGDEVRDLACLEGRPILGFRGLLWISRFRFQLRLHWEPPLNFSFLHSSTSQPTRV